MNGETTQYLAEVKQVRFSWKQLYLDERGEYFCVFYVFFRAWACL